jgi:hypothetical protein
MAVTSLPRKNELLQSVFSRTKLTLMISSHSWKTWLASRDCSWGLCIKSMDLRALAAEGKAWPPPRMMIKAESCGRKGWRTPAGIGMMRWRGVCAPIEAIAAVTRSMACGHKVGGASLLNGGEGAAEATFNSTSDRTWVTSFTDETSGAQHVLNNTLHVQSHPNYNHCQ